LILCGAGYTILQRVIITQHGSGSRLAVAVGQDRKGKASVSAASMLPVWRSSCALQRIFS